MKGDLHTFPFQHSSFPISWYLEETSFFLPLSFNVGGSISIMESYSTLFQINYPICISRDINGRLMLSRKPLRVMIYQSLLLCCISIFLFPDRLQNKIKFHSIVVRLKAFDCLSLPPFTFQIMIYVLDKVVELNCLFFFFYLLWIWRGKTGRSRDSVTRMKLSRFRHIGFRVRAFSYRSSSYPILFIFSKKWI